MSKHSRTTDRYLKLHMGKIKPLLRVTVSRDGEAPFVRTLERAAARQPSEVPAGESVARLQLQDAAEMVWLQAGSPKPCSVEVVELTAAFTVDADGTWADV